MQNKVTINKRNVLSTLLTQYSTPLLTILATALASSPSAHATTLSGPGTADITRVTAPAEPAEIKEQKPLVGQPPAPLQKFVPEAYNVKFTLQDLSIQGMTAFSEKDVKDKLAASYIGKEISLTNIYEISRDITKMYREKGYFLSFAIVPEGQDWQSGKVTIKVTEGKITSIVFDNPKSSNYVTKPYIDDLLSKTPLKHSEIESFLLLVNDIPGYSAQGVLDLDQGFDQAKLTIVTAPKKYQGQITFSNYGSDALGKDQFSFSYAVPITDLQTVGVSLLSALDTKRFLSVTASHSMAIGPRVTWMTTAKYSQGKPEGVLSFLNFNTESVYASTGLKYQAIRQRKQNLWFQAGFEALNFSATNSLSSALPTIGGKRDKIRAFTITVYHDRIDDSNNGQASAKLTLTRGVSCLGASSEDSPNLSNPDASPSFLKANLELTRLQKITNRALLVVTATGQSSPTPLLLSQQFGYGGQLFGRAYEPSIITGSKGAAASVELRYVPKSTPSYPVKFAPYAFYDVGVITESEAESNQHGQSLGFGFRATYNDSYGINFAVAWPVKYKIYASSSTTGGTLTDLKPRFGLELFTKF